MLPTIEDAIQIFKDVYTGQLSDYYADSDAQIAELLTDNCDHDPDGCGWNCYVELSEHQNNTGSPCLIEWFDPSQPHN